MNVTMGTGVPRQVLMGTEVFVRGPVADVDGLPVTATMVTARASCKRQPDVDLPVVVAPGRLSVRFLPPAPGDWTVRVSVLAPIVHTEDAYVWARTALA